MPRPTKRVLAAAPAGTSGRRVGLALALAVVCAWPAGAAVRARLVHCGERSPASVALKKTLSGAAFKAAAKGRFVPEFVEEPTTWKDQGDLASLKLPCIFLVSEAGNCFRVFENVPAGATAERLAAAFARADAVRADAEKAGLETADDCGAFLQKMERHVGGPRRVVSPGYFEDVFAKLARLDPDDATGWQRHFTFGLELDAKTKADGLELVIKANAFREAGQLDEGRAFIDAEKKKNRAHLSREQLQSILMAEFALFREDESQRARLNRILARVAQFDERTLWGTAALGWLNMRGDPPLSAYWGWHDGDFTGPRFAATVAYGVDHFFDGVGTYDVTFEQTGGAPVAFESITLLAGDEEAKVLKKPSVSGRSCTFTCDLTRELQGRLTAMVVRGDAPANGASSGRIRIRRRVLRPRASAASAGTAAAAGGGKAAAIVRAYIESAVGTDAIRAIRRREGGAAFLTRFFGDRAWMEQFAGSGPWSSKPFRGFDEYEALAGKALAALDLLVWNDRDGFIATPTGRNIATALALCHGGDWDDEKLVQVMACYRTWTRDGTLDAGCAAYDVREWREVLGFGQNAELDVSCLKWMHDFANLPRERYAGLCWQCHYRTFNCFGASVQGPDYYTPWAHRWNTQELRYRVGGVCGALSKFGSHGAASHGIRSFTAGQPGHCAYLVWNGDRWTVAYSVTGHTAPHNTLGGNGFAALEEQDRYFSNPKRMEAERLRWAGEWEKAMRAANGNWSAAVGWYNDLERRSASAAEWDAWSAAVRETFADAPAQGWQLVLARLGKVGARAARLAEAKAALAAMKESAAETAEPGYWDDIALKPLDKLFPGDDPAAWEIFGAALDAQAGTPTFFRQTVAWGAERLMKDAASSQRFLAVVGRRAAKTGEKLDYKAMVLRASTSGDLAMFRQVYALLDRLAPGDVPRATGTTWPTRAFGGELLSPLGLLQTSSTSIFDNPVVYRNALDAEDFAAGNAFHTAKEDEPWGMVVLPGTCMIAGVTVVNVPGQNAKRQAPIAIWASEDGVAFTKVFSSDEVEDEWSCFLGMPVRAKYVKVGRVPGAKNEFFHLRKILVYGRKLY